MPRYKTADDWIKRAYEIGMTVKAICEIASCAKETVGRRAKKYGWVRSTPDAVKIKRHVKLWESVPDKTISKKGNPTHGLYVGGKNRHINNDRLQDERKLKNAAADIAADPANDKLFNDRLDVINRSISRQEKRIQGKLKTLRRLVRQRDKMLAEGEIEPLLIARKHSKTGTEVYEGKKDNKIIDYTVTYDTVEAQKTPLDDAIAKLEDELRKAEETLNRSVFQAEQIVALREKSVQDIGGDGHDELAAMYAAD